MATTRVSEDFVKDFYENDLGIPQQDVTIPLRVRDAQQESNSVEIAKRKAKREAQGTDRSSGSRVKNAGKKKSKEISKGGATTHKNSQSRTNFIPDPNSEASLKNADYYRTGLYTTKLKEFGGETVEVQEWAPLPELVTSVSDDYDGVLASIKLIDPKKIKKNDIGSQNRGQLIPEYSKFFLEGVQESHQEKVQVVETFNDFYAFFYGEKPPIYTFSGHLLNLKNYNWLNEFMYYYQNFWRGTKAVQIGARVFLTYNYQQIQGYILNISTNLNAVTDKAAPFNLQILVTKRLIFNGFDGDDLIRDNLLPKTDSGFINTSANPLSQILVKDYLEGNRPASGLDIVDDSNTERGIRTEKDNTSSTKKETFAGGNEKNKRFMEVEDEIKKAAGVPLKRGTNRAGALKQGIFSKPKSFFA